MKHWILVATLPLLIIGCSAQQLGNTAEDKLIKGIESACIVNRGDYAIVNESMKMLGGQENSENDWFFAHGENDTLSQHQLYTSDSKCYEVFRDWERYNKGYGTNHGKPFDYKKFQKKFAGYFKAKYLKEMSAPHPNDIGQRDDHYTLTRNGKEYFVVMENATRVWPERTITVWTREQALEAGVFE